jgi:hypothetical protein
MAGRALNLDAIEGNPQEIRPAKRHHLPTMDLVPSPSPTPLQWGDHLDEKQDISSRDFIEGGGLVRGKLGFFPDRPPAHNECHPHLKIPDSQNLVSAEIIQGTRK